MPDYTKPVSTEQEALLRAILGHADYEHMGGGTRRLVAEYTARAQAAALRDAGSYIRRRMPDAVHPINDRGGPNDYLAVSSAADWLEARADALEEAWR